jgi:Lon-like protease
MSKLMSTSMPTSEITVAAPPITARRRRRRWPIVLVALIVVVSVAVIVSSFVTVPYYALVPGDAQPVSKLIKLPPAQSHSEHGSLLLTDVGVENVSLLGLLPAWLNSDTTLVSSQDLTAGLPIDQFDAEGTVDMEESELTAQAVAIRQLGYQVPERDAGVTVYVIDPGSPASRTLHIGDVITSIDGTPTTNPQELQTAVRSHRPGDSVTLEVGSIDNPLQDHAATLRLGSTKGPHGAQVPFIGIGDPAAPIPGMGTQPYYSFPFAVHINSDEIGGPSAGLAWTLGIVDSVSGGSLTGGRKVAATGTIHPDGTIGDVGGVAQKTVAVERAGASVFFVPQVELATARSKATSGLKVYGVTSLQQVLHDLQRLGGQLGQAKTGPPPGPAGHSVPYLWQDSPWT